MLLKSLILYDARMKSEGSVMKRWSAVVMFAIAMAWMEAAVVLYLRTLVNRIEPYQPNPLPEFEGLILPEIIREAATMVMLTAVGWLAGKTWRGRFGYLLIAFGVWDIFYYVFLKILTGWPRTFLDWDILFLIPLPWWGPVMAPMSIAALMILFGTLSVQRDPVLWPGRRSICLSALGVALSLWAFMYDPLQLVLQGASATSIRDVLPEAFPWILFLVGLGLTGLPAIDLALQFVARTGLNRTPSTQEQK
jgi:hypothetical protein